ncbi:MAG: hypothetical protein ABL923_14305, partial [Burkholderiaceae bacterium]
MFSTVFAIPTVAHAQASACVLGAETLQTFSFPASWTNGTTGPYDFTVGAGANAVNLRFSITGTQAFTAGSPTQGTIGNIANTVRAQHTGVGTNALLSTQNLIFLNRPVNKLRFISADVDSNVFQDVVRTRVNGSVVPTSMVPVTPANITINAAAGTATAIQDASQCGINSTACNVTSNFNTTGITSASQAFETGPTHVSSAQYVGWNSFSWCLPALSNITLRKTWVNATVNDAVTVAAAGGTPALISLASVANTAGETDTGAVQSVPVNSVLTLSETFTTGSAANYNTAVACTGTTGLVGSTLTVGATNTNIVCTFTNTKKTATVTLRKAWTNATLNDAVTVAATGLTSLASVANTATETDTGAAQTVNVGSVLTLSETFTTGSAANYNSNPSCTGTTGLVGSTLTVGAADTAIVCTYTNTKKTATVTLRKSWSGATLNDAVNVTATGLTTLASVANTATEIDSGAAQTVNVGNVLTLAENFTTGSAANYNTTLACTGTSGLSGSTLTVGSADTVIVCTYTNSKQAPTLTKAFSPASISIGGTSTLTFTVSNPALNPAQTV